METNGVITAYLFKWMKNCDYLRMMKLPETLDCLRVPPENTTSFQTKREDGFTLGTTIDGLTPFTWYRCEVCAETIKGVGPCYNTTYQTDEGGKFNELNRCFQHHSLLSGIVWERQIPSLELMHTA